MPTIQPSLYQSLTHRMNYLVARQGVIAGNIANADTPGYLAQDLTFHSAMQAQGGTLAMAGTQGGHLSGGGSGAYGTSSQSTRFIQHNGNAVRLDAEMLKMQETSLGYRLATQLYAKQITLQKIALGKAQ